MQIPIKIPPGMPPAQAQALMAYLEANPDAAKAAMGQAQQIMQNPALAQAFLNMNVGRARPHAGPGTRVWGTHGWLGLWGPAWWKVQRTGSISNLKAPG